MQFLSNVKGFFVNCWPTATDFFLLRAPPNSNKLGAPRSCDRFCFPSSRLGLHISIHTVQFHHGFILKAKTSSFSGYESARVNGFSILLFIKREYLSSTPCDVKAQSVIQSESSVGTHWIDSVAPNPKRLHVCVLFVHRHPTASGNSQSPCVSSWSQVCCVIKFLKLHLLN